MNNWSLFFSGVALALLQATAIYFFWWVAFPAYTLTILQAVAIVGILNVVNSIFATV